MTTVVGGILALGRNCEGVGDHVRKIHLDAGGGSSWCGRRREEAGGGDSPRQKNSSARVSGIDQTDALIVRHRSVRTAAF